MRVPDTVENEATFGRVPTRWESTGGYPVLRLVTLMVLRQHALTGLALGAYRDSELGLAASSIARDSSISPGFFAIPSENSPLSSSLWEMEAAETARTAPAPQRWTTPVQHSIEQPSSNSAAVVRSSEASSPRQTG